MKDKREEVMEQVGKLFCKALCGHIDGWDESVMQECRERPCGKLKPIMVLLSEWDGKESK